MQQPEVPRLIEAIYGIPAPATPREDLTEVFLTGICNRWRPMAVDALDADLNSQLLNAGSRRHRAFREAPAQPAVPPDRAPSRLGVIGGDLQGFPNGRRLADDVIDIELQVLEGELTGDDNDVLPTVSTQRRRLPRRVPLRGPAPPAGVNRS